MIMIMMMMIVIIIIIINLFMCLVNFVMQSLKNKYFAWVVVVCTFNTCTQEGEAGGTL